VSRLRAFPAVLLLFCSLPGFVRGQEAPADSPPKATENPNPAPPQSGLPSIQVTAGLVHLMVTVTDKKRNLITDLEEKDFHVSENGMAQSIRFFGRETDLPLRIGLLLDTSNSIRSRLSFEQEAAIDFLNKVIRRDQDMAFLMTFDNEPEVVQDFTGDVGLLAEAIHRQRAGGGTALNDAIYRASEILSNPPLPKGEQPEVRRVIVVLSDGDDNLSERALSDAIEGSIRAEAVVYAISTNTEWLAIDDVTRPTKYHLGEGDKVLQQFADLTGGRAFFPYKVDDLAQSFLDIGDELRAQYFIAYAPAVPLSQGKYRRIEVQADRKNVIIRSRKGYYPAPTGPQSAPASSETPLP
jgi:Ca-activated chloride channel family protein